MEKLIRWGKDECGVVSVEWIILSILIMVAITGAFSPTFQAAVSNGITAVSNVLNGQTSAAGS